VFSDWINDKFFPGMIRGFIDLLNFVGNAINKMDIAGIIPDIPHIGYGIYGDSAGAD